MTRKSVQLRMSPELHEQVRYFASRTSTSINALMLEALDRHLSRLSLEVEVELTEELERVRKYSGRRSTWESEGPSKKTPAGPSSREASAIGTAPSEAKLARLRRKLAELD